MQVSKWGNSLAVRLPAGLVQALDLKEGEEMLLIENWAYLGSARSEEDIWKLMDGRDACFDKDTYKILLATIGRLQPLRITGDS